MEISSKCQTFCVSTSFNVLVTTICPSQETVLAQTSRSLLWCSFHTRNLETGDQRFLSPARIPGHRKCCYCVSVYQTGEHHGVHIAPHCPRLLSGFAANRQSTFCVSHGDHKWMEVPDKESGIDAAPDSVLIGRQIFRLTSACSLFHSLIHSNYISYIF